MLTPKGQKIKAENQERKSGYNNNYIEIYKARKRSQGSWIQGAEREGEGEPPVNQLYYAAFHKNAPFLSFEIQSNNDQFTRNYYQI